jgi:hypothetical protein
MDPSLLEPYDRMIRIVILGRLFEVPANNLLLRQMQFLSEEIGYGKYCWNGECRYCEVQYRRSTEDGELIALACRVKGQEGMQLTRLAAEVKYNLSEVLSSAPKAPE